MLLRQAESSARSLVFEGVGAAFEVGAGEAFEFEWLWYRTEERDRIITLKLLRGLGVFPIIIPQFKLAMEIRKAR